MKRIIYWLMGEQAGRTLTASWKWLWGLPIDPGGKIAVEAAQESLHSMQESVAQFTESVAKIMASYQRAKEKYQSKQGELRQFEQQAALAHRNGNDQAARLAMSKAIAVEHLLPQLASQVAQAQKILQANQEKLDRERQRLETYKIEMQNLKDLSDVNEALAAITKVNSDIRVDSARSQFERAQASIQSRHLETNAIAELSSDPAEKLVAELNKLTLDDEIDRRLQTLNELPATEKRDSE